VSMNVSAFRWGRRAAHDPRSVQSLVDRARTATAVRNIATTIDEVIERRADFLKAYQNKSYAERYLAKVAEVRAAENAAVPGSTAVTEAVARSLFKMMAIKDEYEVARLYTDGAFSKQLAGQFQSWDRLEFHLAPPILGRTSDDGKPRKSRFGPWMMKGFAMLAALKGLRGTALDIFGYTAERKMERRLLGQYEADVDTIRGLLKDRKSVV